MIVTELIKDQVFQVLVMSGAGIFAAVSYGLFQRLCSWAEADRYFRSVMEIIFWAGAAAAVWQFLYYCSYGRISVYGAAAFGAGALLWRKLSMAKKRRSSQFKDSSQVIDIEEARKKRQEKRKKQKKQAMEQEAAGTRKVRAGIRANKRRRALFYVLVILGIVVVIGASILNIVKLNGEYKEAKEEHKRLEQEKEDLQKQLEDSRTTEFIEEQAREQLRMVEENETIYVAP